MLHSTVPLHIDLGVDKEVVSSYSIDDIPPLVVPVLGKEGEDYSDHSIQADLFNKPILDLDAVFCLEVLHDYLLFTLFELGPFGEALFVLANAMALLHFLELLGMNLVVLFKYALAQILSISELWQLVWHYTQALVIPVAFAAAIVA